MDIFPKDLQAICDFLNSQKTLNLTQGSGDGRADSASSEKEIISILLNEESLPRIKGANVNVSNNRSWYDFSIKADGKEYYVDIKIGDMNKGGADNTNCASAIYYVLTGCLPPSSNQGIIQKIKYDAKENDEDFYFLVVNKNHSPAADDASLSRAYLFSLRSLAEVRTNGNNLPFQCVWKNNIKPVRRNYAEAKKFLLSNYGESARKRADMYDDFKQYFPEYLE